MLDTRLRVDKALTAVVKEANTGGISTSKVNALVEALGSSTGISKSEMSPICQGLDKQRKAFLGPAAGVHPIPLRLPRYDVPIGRLSRNLHLASQAVMAAIGIEEPQELPYGVPEKSVAAAAS